MENVVVDGYVVKDYIGQGSFGVVYTAEKDGIIYACKFIDLKHIASAYDSPKRLDREIEALKRVNSKYTVKYIADGYYENDHRQYIYIIMEYVKGTTLKQLLINDKAPWDVNSATEFVIEVINGINEIHSQNLIHRDIKPDNLVICDNGQIKIIDYGLSKIIDFSTITRSGTRIGAPHFMSPEQILDGKNITHVSDYYAIGVIMYLLLTGELLFESVREEEITYKTLHAKPPAPSSLNPATPINIERVTLKLLAKAPYERYKTASEIIDALKSKTLVPSNTSEDDRVKFYPRLMHTDAAILENFASSLNLDGADYPIHLHKLGGRIDKLLKKSSDFDLFADPGTNRMVYTGYRKTASLKDLPYAPTGFNPYEVEDFEEEARLEGFVKSVIDLQIANDCTILTAPNFFFDSAFDDWFDLNIRLLRSARGYIDSNYPGYKLLATICTKAETLSRKKEQKKIIEHYGNNGFDYLAFYVDSIRENMNDAQLYNYIDTALKIKEFTKAKLIGCRIPAVGLGLLTIGFDAITSGLGVLDTFDKAIIEKENDFATMPQKQYFPDLLTSVSTKAPGSFVADIISFEGELREEYPEYEINLETTLPSGVSTSNLSPFNQIPKLKFLFARSAELADLNTGDVQTRKAAFIKRIDKAIVLRKALAKKSVKLGSGAESTDGLAVWREVLKQF